MSRHNPKRVRIWRALIDAWMQSGQSVNGFCRDRKLTRSNFDRWRRILARDPRAVICVDDDRPPYSFVQVQGTVSISEDPADLLDIATRAGGRYMGADRAEEYGRRNGVPGELVVRLRPTKVLKAFDLAE